MLYGIIRKVRALAGGGALWLKEGEGGAFEGGSLGACY